jgi:hypothetical protein
MGMKVNGIILLFHSTETPILPRGNGLVSLISIHGMGSWGTRQLPKVEVTVLRARGVCAATDYCTCSLSHVNVASILLMQVCRINSAGPAYLVGCFRLGLLS